ncbi:hypothetical protein CRG98_040366 [Punica granatum]|uniref:Major facilitator superfamily (MFS) profile domain-containing protein n=1 Tax=Punica granatum TaxID=22663 RepID=A0A2I0I5I5_PUNGR|nr:hypothetical protein CRG98_040366 [Punica granatum]
MGGLIFGYCIGISGNSHTSFCSDHMIFTNTQVASSFASPLIRAFGRKPSILVEGAAFLTSAALGGSAFNVYMLIFSRVLLGVGVSFPNQSVPLCMSEMAPSRYSGAFSNGFKFCVATGNLSANIINYGTEKIKGGWGWRLSLALAVVPASILTLGVGALFFPETPNSLIQQGNNREKANSVLRRIRGTNNVKKEFDEDLVKRLQGGIWVVMGLARVAGPNRSDISGDVMPFQVRDFLLFRGVAGYHEHVCVFAIAGEENVPIEQMDRVWREHWLWESMMIVVRRAN